jgi:hypothetical protein
MAIDLRRCAEAAAHAALAEAFAPPEPKPRPRRRRIRPVRTVLLGVGLVTTIRIALSPELRRSIIESLAERFPIEDLLDELVVDADVVPDSDDHEEAAAAEDESGVGSSGSGSDDRQTDGPQRRRRVTRARGDSNGQHGRKPPNRGTRA